MTLKRAPRSFTPGSHLLRRISRSRYRGCFGRRLLLAGYLVLASSAFRASAAHDGDSILTRLVFPVDEDGVVIPVCSQCKAGTKKISANGGSSSTGAVVTFTFDDDDLAAYVGGVRTKVRLFDGTEHEVFSELMTIADGETVTFDLDNGVDWTWDQVDAVFFELLDPQ